MMKLGDKKWMRPTYSSRDIRFPSDNELLEGTVVYIHPKRRFYTLQFKNRYGETFRESFYFPSRGGNPDNEEVKR